jgi:hypothetical protein
MCGWRCPHVWLDVPACTRVRSGASAFLGCREMGKIGRAKGLNQVQEHRSRINS